MTKPKVFTTLCTDSEKAFGMLCTHIKRTRVDWCNIASFGFYAGVTASGVIYPKHPCYQLLDALLSKHVSTNIYVGIPPNETEFGDRGTTIVRMHQTVKRFPNVHFYKTTLHSKMILLNDGYGMFGSMNFTGSSLGDCTLVGYICNCCDTSIFDFFRRNIAAVGEPL